MDKIFAFLFFLSLSLDAFFAGALILRFPRLITDKPPVPLILIAVLLPLLTYFSYIIYSLVSSAASLKKDFWLIRPINRIVNNRLGGICLHLFYYSSILISTIIVAFTICLALVKETLPVLAPVVHSAISVATTGTTKNYLSDELIKLHNEIYNLRRGFHEEKAEEFFNRNGHSLEDRDEVNRYFLDLIKGEEDIYSFNNKYYGILNACPLTNKIVKEAECNNFISSIIFDPILQEAEVKNFKVLKIVTAKIENPILTLNLTLSGKLRSVALYPEKAKRSTAVYYRSLILSEQFNTSVQPVYYKISNDGNGGAFITAETRQTNGADRENLSETYHLIVDEYDNVQLGPP